MHGTRIPPSVVKDLKRRCGAVEACAHLLWPVSSETHQKKAKTYLEPYQIKESYLPRFSYELS